MTLSSMARERANIANDKIVKSTIKRYIKQIKKDIGRQSDSGEFRCYLNSDSYPYLFTTSDEPKDISIHNKVYDEIIGLLKSEDFKVNIETDEYDYSYIEVRWD